MYAKFIRIRKTLCLVPIADMYILALTFEHWVRLTVKNKKILSSFYISTDDISDIFFISDKSKYELGNQT